MLDEYTLTALVVIVLAIAGYFLLSGNKTPPRTAQAKPKQEQKAKTKSKHAVQDWTREQVAQHNKSNDLFLIVNKRVYDVTSFVSVHPGGDAILKHAGKDNTATIFHDEHPATVKDQLEEYYIGKVVD